MQALAKQSSKRGEVFRPNPLIETQKQVSGHGFATQEQENTQNSTLDNYAGGIEHSFSQIPLFRPNSPFIQPKLTINTPNDIYEQEADSMAERVMNLPEKSPLPNPTISQLNNVIQRKCAKCGEEDDEKEGTLMRKAEYGGSFQTPPTLSTQLNASKGIGSPLPEKTRGLMQNAFNADFSGVRIHTGNSANDMSRGIQARAFTHGQDIYFNRGEYSPESGEGKRLLAHELTHTLQQSGSNIQRKEATEQQEESPSSQPSTFIVEDNSAPAAGQMTKSEFLATLNAAVCATVDQELRGTPYSSDNCPYISAAFSRHQNSSATQIEQLLARYEPNTTSAQTAEGLIGLVLRRVSVAVNRWKQRGNLADVPEDITGLLAEGGSDAPPKSTGEAGQSVAPSLQFKANAGGANATQSPQAVMQNLGKGSPLDGSTRGRMESAFGTNFGNVEIHTDSNASNLASGMNARAFAVGNHIAFGSGEHQPGTLMGDALMAHELAHTVQQGNGVSNEGGTSAYSSLEEDADSAAMSAISLFWRETKGEVKVINTKALPRLRSGLKLQRCESCSRVDPNLLRMRELNQIIDPERLANELESESVQRLNIIKSISEVSSTLRIGIEWEIAFRSKNWAEILTLIRQDNTSSFFVGYTTRLQNLIESNQTVFSIIQTTTNTNFRSEILDLFHRLIALRYGYRLIIELQAANQRIEIQPTTSENATGASASQVTDGRFVMNDDIGRALLLVQQHRGTSVGSVVSINVGLLSNQSVLGGTQGNLSLINADPTVTFGHELIHALHNARGTNTAPPVLSILYRFSGGKSNYLVQDPATGASVSPEELHTATGQTVFSAPIPAQGIQETPNWALSFDLPQQEIITENMLRQEQNLPLRVSHFGSQTATHIIPRAGETIDQMIDRYSLPRNQAISPNMRIVIHQIFVEFNPYFSTNTQYPTIAGITVSIRFPHPKYISMYLRFVLNDSTQADLAENLILRA